MWLVCQYKESGDLFVQTRVERDNQNNVLFGFGEGIPSRVLKTFYDKETAEKYIEAIEAAIKLINKSFEK